MPDEWITRPEGAPSDWPYGDLRRRLAPVSLGVRLPGGLELFGGGMIYPDGLEMNDADPIPWAEVQAYMVLPPAPIDHSDELGRD